MERRRDASDGAGEKGILPGSPSSPPPPNASDRSRRGPEPGGTKESQRSHEASGRRGRLGTGFASADPRGEARAKRRGTRTRSLPNDRQPAEHAYSSPPILPLGRKHPANEQLLTT